MIDPDPIILGRCREVLTRAGVDLLLAGDPCTVAYLTGFAPPFEGGPNPWAGGPTVAILGADHVSLVAADAPTTTDERDNWSVSVQGYPAYTYQYPLHSTAAYHGAVRAVVGSLAPRRGRIGVEGSWIPAAVQGVVADECPGLAWVDAGGLFDEIRMVKSPREIERLRAVMAMGDVMQQAVRDLAVPGMAEIDVFSGAKARMEKVAGARVPVRAALRGGCGSAEIWSTEPQRYELRAGDLVVSDLLPQWQGYWADSCSAVVVGGEPSVEQARLHRIAREALEAGVDAARPGITADALERRVRAVVNRHGYDYPHHTGHGIGVGLHEPPYIYKDAPTVLRAGMVIALEPAVYVDGIGGIRQEVSILIGADGAEILSRNALTLA